MKINIWKITTIALAFGIVCIFTLSSFKSSKYRMTPGGEGTKVLKDRAEVRKYYGNFLTAYPLNNFGERSGTISKSALEELLSKMTNGEDVLVYYYFGRTDDGKNVVMLFNDPKYNSLNETQKFVTSDPFCPPNCNNVEMNDYVTTDK